MAQGSSWRKDEIKFDIPVEISIEPNLSDPRRILDTVEVGIKAFLDAEHRIAVDERIIGIKDIVVTLSNPSFKTM